MYRDFSESSKQKFLGLVSEVENEKFSDFTDWVGDRWYDFESWIGRLNIRNYLNDVNAYHKKVIDKNNTTKKTIKNIFREVEDVDKAYQGLLSSENSSLQKWDRYFAQMTEIINEKGNFTPEYISHSLETILKQYSVNESNAELDLYLEFDQTTENYIYHWDKIENLFSKDARDLKEADYQILLAILSSMFKEGNDEKAGEIDVYNLEKFINAGYTRPEQITSNDFHESYYSWRDENGERIKYYYIQNKSYMTDILKMVCLMYKETYSQAPLDSQANYLNNLMQAMVENYPVIEWREQVNPATEFWSGDLYIIEEDLKSFNERCQPGISLEYVNAADASGLDYYLIKSNAVNLGNVRTATDRSNGNVHFVERNEPDVDNYSDCTIRMYVDCKNKNSSIEAVALKSKTILAGYYQEFDFGEVLGDELIKTAIEYVPVAGNMLSSLYDLTSQTDLLGVIASGLGIIESANLNEVADISKSTEKKIDRGIGEINRGVGICAEYIASEVNNKRVKNDKETVDKISRNFQNLNNLGLKHNTMIVKYDHCKGYSDYGTGIEVDNDKNCDTALKCDIIPRDYEFDSGLLRDQYENIMHKIISDADFADLEKQVREYIKTGKIEGDILIEYMDEWLEE